MEHKIEVIALSVSLSFLVTFAMLLSLRHPEAEPVPAPVTSSLGCPLPMIERHFQNDQDSIRYATGRKDDEIVYVTLVPAKGGVTLCAMPEWTWTLERALSQP